MSSHRTIRITVLGLAVPATLFILAMTFAPVLVRDGSVLGWAGHAAGAFLCHQIDERSFVFDGAPLGVCARCTGLYAGGVLGLVAGGLIGAWRMRATAAVFFILIGPTLLDAALPLTGLFGYTGLSNLPRMLISLPAGAACGWFLAVAVGQILDAA